MPTEILERSLKLEEQKIVYKRNSSWWFATCYLFGTLFLVIYAVISLLGLFTDIGVSGIKALSENSENTKLRKSLTSKIKKDVQLVGYKVVQGSGENYLTISIKNNSSFSLSGIHVEIAALDPQGLPSYTHDEWLHDLQTVFPGDTAHAKLQLPISGSSQSVEYVVRISDFGVVGENTFDEYCKAELATKNESI